MWHEKWSGCQTLPRAVIERPLQGLPHLKRGQEGGCKLPGKDGPSTLLEEENLIVGLAVVVALKLVAITTLELNTTLLASEMAGVHELTLDEEVGT